METKFYLVTLTNKFYDNDKQRFIITSNDSDSIFNALLKFLKYENPEYLKDFHYKHGYGSYKDSVEWSEYEFEVGEIKVIN